MSKNIDPWELLKEAKYAMEGGTPYQKDMVEIIEEALNVYNTRADNGWVQDRYAFCNDIGNVEAFVYPCDEGWKYQLTPLNTFRELTEAQKAASAASKSLCFLTPEDDDAEDA